MAADKRIPVFMVGGENWYPLALGTLQSMAQFGPEKLGRYFEFISVPSFFLEMAVSLAQKSDPGIWMFSDYVWNDKQHMRLSAKVKEISAKHITIHGGPSAPRYMKPCEEYLVNNPNVDIVVRGEGEMTFTALLQHFLERRPVKDAWKAGLDQVRGIMFTEDAARTKFIRTEDRDRIAEPDIIPSPYLNDVFENYGHSMAATLESNRGCPYGCTFCDWGSLTQQKIKLFDMDRVKAEIDWIGQKELGTVFIADANFGIFDRDVEIAEYFVKAKEKYGYPKEIIASYAKNATMRLAEIIKTWTRADLTGQGIIAIQTSDEKTLEITKRKNIKTEKYDELADVFRQENLPLSTDLMIGLPGATLYSFKEDLQRYFDKDITVKAYPTRLLPNSPMADPEYLKKNKIVTDEYDVLISTFSYTVQDYARMRLLYKYYHLLEEYGYLRYILRYLQWDHGIKSLDFLQELILNQSEVPSLTPLLKVDDSRPKLLQLSGTTLASFYNEISAFVMNHFKVNNTPDFNAVVAFNETVMPHMDVQYPLQHDLEYDIISYVQDYQENGESGKLLTEYEPANVSIEDRENLTGLIESHYQGNRHQIYWELYTPIRKPKSAAFLIEGEREKLPENLVGSV